MLQTDVSATDLQKQKHRLAYDQALKAKLEKQLKSLEEQENQATEIKMKIRQLKERLAIYNK